MKLQLTVPSYKVIVIQQFSIMRSAPSLLNSRQSHISAVTRSVPESFRRFEYQALPACASLYGVLKDTVVWYILPVYIGVWSKE